MIFVSNSSKPTIYRRNNMTDENQEWQEPLPPQDFKKIEEKPQMSLVQTLTDIFFDPGAVFEDLRRKPFARLVTPLVLISVLIAGYSFLLTERIGQEQIVREQLKSKWMDMVPDEQKQKMLEDAKQTSAARTVINSVIGGVFVLVIFVIMGLVYWGGGLAFGGNGTFWHGLAVVAYSTLPPTLVAMLASYVILYLKDPADISFIQSQTGLLKLNPTLLIDSTPVVNALLSRFDLLVLWGMFLAVIGLQKCFKISSGAAWGFSIIMWLIGTAFAVVGGLFAG
jgi:hypothetical protein